MTPSGGREWWWKKTRWRLGGCDGRRRGKGDSGRRGGTDYTFCRRVHEERGAAGWAGGQAAGDYEPGEYDLLDQAFYGSPVQRSERRDEDGAVQGCTAGRPYRHRGAGQGVH